MEPAIRLEARIFDHLCVCPSSAHTHTHTFNKIDVPTMCESGASRYVSRVHVLFFIYINYLLEARADTHTNS